MIVYLVAGINRMSVLPETKVAAYQKTQGICIICGKSMVNDMSNWNVEHYIPRAVYKWLGDDRVKNLLESPANLFIVHYQCNNLKDSNLPTPKKIQSLHTTADIKRQILGLYKTVEPAIAQYQAIKKATWDAQNSKCAFCAKLLSLNQATLRRKHNDLPRSPDNAMCLCFGCSVRAGNEAYKTQMVNAVFDNNIQSR